jgi:hypothetical protein
MSRTIRGMLALALTLSVGCRESTNPAQQDATVNPHEDGGVGDAASTGDGGGEGYDSVSALLGAPPALQTGVTINSAVATALAGNYKTLYVQDLVGGPKSGIAVYCNFDSSTHPCPIPKTTMKTFKPGMTVKVVGTYNVSYGQTVVYPSAITVLDANSTALPPFAQLTAAQAVETLTSSDYAGCLVTITGVSSSSPLTVKSTAPAGFENSNFTTDCTNGPSFGAFEVWDNTSTIAVTTKFYRGIDLGTDAICIMIYDGGTPADRLVVVGDKFNELSGVLDVDSFDLNGLILSPAAKDQYEYVAAGDHDGGL